MAGRDAGSSNTNMALAKEYWQIQGPPGRAGTDGTNGINGINAFCRTSASFIVPAVGSDVVVPVEPHTGVTFDGWEVPFAIGQVVFVETAGHFEVSARPATTQVTLNNLGYAGNSAVGSVIAQNRRVSPAGLIGP